MGGNNYRVFCSECGKHEDFEIYDDGWLGLTIDSTHTLCPDCDKKERLEYYYDYECVMCNKWFNQDKRIGNYIEPLKGYACEVCVLNVVKLKMMEAMNDARDKKASDI